MKINGYYISDFQERGYAICLGGNRHNTIKEFNCGESAEISAIIPTENDAIVRFKDKNYCHYLSDFLPETKKNHDKRKITESLK